VAPPPPPHGTILWSRKQESSGGGRGSRGCDRSPRPHQIILYLVIRVVRVLCVGRALQQKVRFFLPDVLCYLTLGGLFNDKIRLTHFCCGRLVFPRGALGLNEHVFEASAALTGKQQLTSEAMESQSVMWSQNYKIQSPIIATTSHKCTSTRSQHHDNGT
jgi:hypothetical protein